MMSMCPDCIQSSQQRLQAELSAANEEKVHAQHLASSTAAAPSGSEPGRSYAVQAGSAAACVLIGTFLLLIGFFFLVVSPSEGGSELLGRDVINLQRLYLGQTSAICGAVFLAAGLRPRSA
jgi:hypothetical protein